MPTPRRKYPFKRYLQLVFYVALFGVMNTLFTNLFQSMVGHFDVVYLSIVSMGVVAYAILFAFIFWSADSTGSIGRLLGAKDAEGK